MQFNVSFTGTISITPAGGGGYVGPLDIQDGALVAYSAGRALSSAMRGSPVYTIRRDSDDAAQTFSTDAITGLISHPAISGFLDGTEGFVTLWKDQGGNSQDLSQADPTSQPQWESDEPSIDDQPYLSFSTNLGSGSISLSTAGDITFPSGQMTIFMLVAGDFSFHARTGSGPNVDFESGPNAFNDMTDADSNEAYGGYSNELDDTQYTIFETVWEYGSNTMVRNGVALTRTDNFDNGGPLESLAARLTLLGNNGYTGVAELLAYPAILSAPTRALIRQNIADHYGITLP